MKETDEKASDKLAPGRHRRAADEEGSFGMLKLRSVQIAEDGVDSNVELTVDDGTGRLVTFNYPGHVIAKMQSHSAGYLHLEIDVTPPRKKEMHGRNLPPERFVG